MKLKLLLAKLAFASTLALSAVAAISVASNNGGVKANAYSPSTTYNVDDTASELASYYSGISSTATGDTLLSQLRSLNDTKKKTTVGYGSMGTSASGAFSYTDYDPAYTSTDSKGQKYGSRILSFYTKTSATSFNREHTWPNSHGGSLIEGDIHMTRPTITSENSDRGNSFYVEGKADSSNGWDPYTAGYAKEMRGECARIILYGVVANSTLNLVAADYHSTSKANPDYLMGNMHTLIKWHFDYSPNEYEMNRNNGAQYLQGNRNPFIDHPEYVAKIWSSFDSTVSSICQQNASMYTNWVPGSASSYGTNDGTTPATAPTKLTLNTTSESLIYGQTLSLSVTPTPSDAASSVTWSSSNTNIATVDDNGLVTAKSTTGYVNITATSTIDTSIKAVCQIYVTEPSPVSVTSITPTAASSTIKVGRTTAINTTYAPSNAYPVPTYTYSSSNTSIATVDSNGLVTGVSAGSATITVKAFQDGTQKDSKTVAIKVEEGSGNFEKVTSTSEVTEGDYLIVYESGNVAFNGGLSTLDAASNTISVTINDNEIEANSTTEAAIFTISGTTNATIKSASGLYIGATSNSNGMNTSNSEAYTNTISFDSNNVNIVGSGGAYLRYNSANDQARFRYYKSSSYSGQKAIQLYKLGSGSSSSASISLDQSEATLEAGTSLTLTPTTSGSGTLAWSSNNESVATVNNGIVSALSAGTAVITATYGGDSATCTITVTAPKTVTNLSLSGTLTNSTQYVGDNFDPSGLTVTATYSDNTTANVTDNVTWSPNPLAYGTTSVTGSYKEFSVSVSLTVETKAITNSIKACYDAYSGSTTNIPGDVYGLYVGSPDNASSIIMNGSYGILLFKVAPQSTWKENETYLKVTKSSDTSKTTLTSYSGLIEIGWCTDSISVISDQSVIASNVEPVSMYKVTGEETASDSVLGSRLCLMTGTVTGTISTIGKDATLKMTVNGNSITLFVKGTNATAENKALLEAGGEITVKGYTSFHDGFQVQFKEVVPIDESYTAQSFAEDLMSMTEQVCATSSNKEGDLSGIWLTIETEKYASLSSSEKQILKDTIADNNGDEIAQAMARYDFIIAHYHSLNNFIGRDVTLVGMNNNFLGISAENSTAIIIVVSVIALSSIGALVFLRKRKED